MHLGGLLSTQEASFVLSNLPRASITPWLHAARLPFLNFIFGVQGNGMGFLTILRTRKILIVLSGHFLIIYFIRNNFEYILNNFECILN